jgi:hypothetical protein
LWLLKWRTFQEAQIANILGGCMARSFVVWRDWSIQVACKRAAPRQFHQRAVAFGY